MRPRITPALWATFFALVLSGCSMRQEEAPAPVSAEPAVESCAAPGEDDGIGGTGCPVD